MSAPCHLDTCTIESIDPAETSPVGRLSLSVRVHPFGGLACRDDITGRGLAVALLGDPLAAEWDSSHDADLMPLRQSSTGRLWAPPYPRRIEVSGELASQAIAAPSGDAGDFALLTSAVSATVTNPTGYPMLVERFVTVLGASLGGPNKACSYALQADGEAWPLFTGFPVESTGVIPTVGQIPVEFIGAQITCCSPAGTLNLQTTIEAVSEIDTFTTRSTKTVYGSHTLRLPTANLDAGASYTDSVRAGVLYHENATNPFDVSTGRLIYSLIAHTVLP